MASRDRDLPFLSLPYLCKRERGLQLFSSSENSKLPEENSVSVLRFVEQIEQRERERERERD